MRKKSRSQLLSLMRIRGPELTLSQRQSLTLPIYAVLICLLLIVFSYSAEEFGHPFLSTLLISFATGLFTSLLISCYFDAKNHAAAFRSRIIDRMVSLYEQTEALLNEMSGWGYSVYKAGEEYIKVIDKQKELGKEFYLLDMPDPRPSFGEMDEIAGEIINRIEQMNKGRTTFVFRKELKQSIRDSLAFSQRQLLYCVMAVRGS